MNCFRLAHYYCPCFVCMYCMYSTVCTNMGFPCHLFILLPRSRLVSEKSLVSFNTAICILFFFRTQVASCLQCTRLYYHHQTYILNCRPISQIDRCLGLWACPHKRPCFHVRQINQTEMFICTISHLKCSFASVLYNIVYCQIQTICWEHLQIVTTPIL